ncbi:MAG: polyhydroxyalkanoate granule-associated phasin [Betaproteobacteria bacterium]
MTKRIRRASRDATRAFELAVSAPQVAALRMMRMAAAGPFPSSRDRGEMLAMGTEKVAAFHEAWQAMAAEGARRQWDLWLSPTFWTLPWMPPARSADWLAGNARRAGLAVLGEGLAPVHRRVVANAKRLRRKVR